MKDSNFDHDPIPSQLKHLVVALFRLDITEPDKIDDDEPLIGDGLGLDSLDVLDLAICIEEEFGLTIKNQAEAHSAFASIASLTSFIRARAPAGSLHTPARQRTILPGRDRVAPHGHPSGIWP